MSPEARILNVVVPTVTVLIHIDLSVHGDSSGDSASASSVTEVEAVAEGSCEAVVAGPRGPMHRHGLLSSLFRHGLRSSMHSYGLQSSQLCLGAPKCLFRLLQSTHPPSLVVLLQCGLRLPGGGVMSVLCGVQCWEGYFGNVIGCRLSKKKITIRYFPKERSLSRACMLVSSWVQERSVEGFPCRQRREPLDPQSKRNRTRDTVVGQGCRCDQFRRAPWVQEVDEAAGEATARWSRVV